MQQSDVFLFSNVGFWFFFGLVLLFNLILRNHRGIRITFLFFTSLYFYYKTGGYFFSLLILSTLTDYSIGIALGRSTNKMVRRLLVATSLLINLSVLAYFKYTYFIADIINELTNESHTPYDYLASAFNSVLGTSFNIDKIALPVGISFFTFQTISYTIDVFRNQVRPVKNIIDFGFYVSFFPQLIAGPIVRARNFVPQIYKQTILSDKWIWWAIMLIIGGLFKKLVISDFISVNLVDRVFEHPISYSGFEIITAIYAYALQIYCDFSGYTDIALGVALLLGFRLPKNFNHPYKATSLSDFWRRWHMSLSAWLRDYLYIPLGGNRKGKIRTAINLLLTMFIGGLWHGAALKFILWGTLHGIGLIINKLFNKIIPSDNRFYSMAGWLLTFHFVTLTWIIFRADSVQNVQIFIDRIIHTTRLENAWQVILASPYIYTLLSMGFLLHWLPDTMRMQLKVRFIKSPVWLKICLAATLLFLIYSLHQNTLLPFIYFRF